MSNEFSGSIIKCVKLLNDMNYLTHAVTHNSLRASKDFKSAALGFDTYRKIYDVGVANQDFNFMLEDNSFFQFTEKVKNEEVRLAFYPNPYSFSEFSIQKKEWMKLFEVGELSQIELEQVLLEEEFSNDIPVIRYDLSLNQYCANYHPAAHFHIGFNSNSRWPVRRILTPYAFFLKILFHYYHELWLRWGDRGAERNILDVEYCKEVNRCAFLNDDYFKRHEHSRLHFI